MNNIDGTTALTAQVVVLTMYRVQHPTLIYQGYGTNQVAHWLSLIHISMKRYNIHLIFAESRKILTPTHNPS